MKQRNASPIKIFLCRIICHFNWPCNINSFDIIVTKGLYPLMYCKINHEQKPSAAFLIELDTPKVCPSHKWLRCNKKPLMPFYVITCYCHFINWCHCLLICQALNVCSKTTHRSICKFELFLDEM